MNGWSYTENNPTNLIDPSGHCSQPPCSCVKSECEKFTEQVDLFINLAQSRQGDDNLTVAMLGTYYSGLLLTLGTPLGDAFVPPPLNIPNPNRPPEDRWPVRSSNGGKDYSAALSLDPFDPSYNTVPRYEAECAAKCYGFKRIFYDNTHHY
ncbi:MAG: hypothetical protein HC875_37260, partial [Anaerolineales bacterium]|nr:hypothetical protein [Anaerolineales bacterium]